MIKTKAAHEILNECIKVQRERGADYDAQGASERSFSKVATAFNAITGKDLTAAEVCLLLQVLKDVRQWQQPNRIHEDSLLNGVSYASLKAEELYKQFGANI